MVCGSACQAQKRKRKAEKAEIVLQQYEFGQLDSLLAVEPRSVVVFLHAEWCRFCKNMQHTTLKDAKVVQLLNEKYYFVSFDGESRAPVTFAGRRFAFEPRGRDAGTHALATALGTIDGELNYPATVILNPEYEITFQYGAFLDAKGLRRVLEMGNSEQ